MRFCVFYVCVVAITESGNVHVFSYYNCRVAKTHSSCNRLFWELLNRVWSLVSWLTMIHETKLLAIPSKHVRTSSVREYTVEYTRRWGAAAGAGDSDVEKSDQLSKRSRACKNIWRVHSIYYYVWECFRQYIFMMGTTELMWDDLRDLR